MKNPLNKRIFRELRTDFGKYAVIFLFMVLTIGLESGDLVAGDSMIAACEGRYEKYHVEHGHFHLKHKAEDKVLRRIEKEDVTVYPDFYVERNYLGADKQEKTLRIYRNRDEVNQICLMAGALPEQDNELVIDRMFADNNQLQPGDELVIEDITYVISGLAAFSDYTTMFEKNSDMMFDSVNFSVAMGTDQCFEELSDKRLVYNYAWVYNQGDPADTIEEKQWSDDLLDSVVKAMDSDGGATELGAMMGVLVIDNGIEEFLPRYANQAMNFAGEDMGSDRGMMLAFLYILIVVMAFIFGVTISHTVAREATVIGTLRASGYTKGELLRQYIAMPVIVTLAASLVGNVLGYTYMKGVIAELYYNSYSLPTYETLWNQQAFLLTTLIPIFLMLLVTGLTLYSKLQLSPIKFIRRDLNKKKNRKAVRLPHFSFFNRFRLRIILQNVSGYLTLVFGIFVASAVLLFGLMFGPLLDDVAGISVENMVSEYQYMLKDAAETDNPDAEKFAARTMDSYAAGYNKEDVTVYGIFDNSRYIREELPEKGAVISSGMAEKYLLEVGDTFLLKEQFADQLVELEVRGIMKSPTTVGVYLAHDYYCDLFEEDEEYYSGYFSDSEITDISGNRIYTCITAGDMTKLADQLKVSMGSMFYVVQGFAVVMFILVVYLLTKIIIEKNSTSISMVKILGYEDGEIGRLYLIATSWVVVLGVVFSLFCVTKLLQNVFVSFMKGYSGWIPFSIEMTTYIKCFGLTIVSYLVVAMLQMKKIKRVPMDEALKNIE